MVEATKLKMSLRFLVMLLAGVSLLAGHLSAQEKNIDKTFPNVVMIDASINGTTGFGAGIVVGARAGRIYIVTANHVVRSGRSEASDIKVRFHFLPGEKFDAKLLDNKDRDMDVAILSVNASGGQVPESEFKFKILGDSDTLERGSDVHPLGNPGAKAWGVALRPEKVASRKATEIAFQSSYIQGGHSGGALLDGCGDIVGLIVRDNAPNGEAVRIESVLELLKQWNYPLNLQLTGGCTASDTASSSNAGDYASTGGARVVEQNEDFPVEVSSGKSPKFRINTAQNAGAFMFTAPTSSSYNISVVSDPSSLDIGWVMVDNSPTNELVVECDNDEPVRGIEPCVAYMRGGLPYYIVVKNLTGDESGEPAAAVEFTITISADLEASLPAQASPTAGDISLRYQGDEWGCTLNLDIQFESNGMAYSLNANPYQISGMTLGEDYYYIDGNISCPSPRWSCAGTGEDSIVLENGSVFDILWQGNDDESCSVWLE
ncbi:MAG: serine protease [Halioglobus sp.]